MNNSPFTTPLSSGKMRGSRQRRSSRPTSQHGAQPHMLGLAQPQRKIFNCIIDDSALVAGVKKSTRNGIRQWVNNGQIRLFVPLHALEQLSKQKSGNNRHAEDVRETLQWLDDATTKYPHAVTLQGGDQYYPDWAEVEQFAVPRSLFSENDHQHTDNEPDEDLPGATQKLTLADLRPTTPESAGGSDMSGSASPSSLQSMKSNKSPVSPPTSPNKAASSPVKPQTRPTSSANAGKASVPPKLQSLFNYILWRIHQELDPIAALESFIFLCNDPNKVNYAKGFNIRYKRLEQLREVLGREDRDYKNRQLVHSRENNSSANIDEQEEEDEEDEEVVFKPSRAPKQQSNVMDPNAFDRNTNVTAPQEPDQPQSPRPNQGQQRGGLGGGRGRGNNSRGRGGRGNSATANARSTPAAQQGSQIDPDSFSRPRGSGNTGRGGRKLWVPTT